jgi:hypothetical protein
MDTITLRIVIRNANGVVVTDETIEAAAATQAEIDDMVSMIEAGSPAWVAAALATQKPHHR